MGVPLHRYVVSGFSRTDVERVSILARMRKPCAALAIFLTASAQSVPISPAGAIAFKR